MSAFDEIRGDVTAARERRRKLDDQVTEAREQLHALQRRIEDAQRHPSGEWDQLLRRLQQQAEAAADRVGELRKASARQKADAIGHLGRLVDLAEPWELIAEWSDAVPIALFPLRLETRFHRPADRRGGRAAQPTQLWIRIYPDEAQVDSFEAMLTDSDLENARSYWIAIWRAAGIEAQERGAWRGFVGATGSGRAAYVIEQYKPLNPGARPAKIDPQDTMLVIVPAVALTPGEQASAIAYHIETWKAKGDRARQDAALAALRAAVGNARATEILEKYSPDPAGQDPPAPYTRAQVRVTVAILELPPPPPTKTNAWTQAPRTFALPDRFVALLWSGGIMHAPVVGSAVPDGLTVGPDPSLDPADQIQKDGDDLAINEDLRWMVDFDRAVEAGMGLKIDLTTDEARRGFDRLIVLGLRSSSDEQESATLLNTLIAHRHASRGGFGLVPQGSATNNTEGDGAAFSWIDDADTSFDVVFKGKDAYAETTDLFERRDGEWLAEALSLEGTLLKRIPHGGGRDQGEARAMNVALWSATLGYALEEMLAPVFTPADIARTKEFFCTFVSGRGPLPAVRFGRQPYGVLPAMAFSRYRAVSGRIGPGEGPHGAFDDYLQRLHALLARLDQEWRRMAADAAHVGAGGGHQTLLDVVGLHSGSVEYHQRYAESFEHLYNKLTLQFGTFFGGLLAQWLKGRSQQVLSAIGADPNAHPPILDKFFYGESPLLSGPVVDDQPLSETKPIRGYTPDQRNYIRWMITSSLDIIRREDFGGNAAPTALLYLLLRHAMMLGHWDAGIRFLETQGLVDAVAARKEPAFVHVESAKGAGTSKFQHLYSPQPQVTGDPAITLGEYLLLPSVLGTAAETAGLRQITGALSFLADTPTARLERLFADHIDTCSYRLDAWKTGIAAHRLGEMRRARAQAPAPGVYLGSFGWLEEVRPREDRIEPVRLDAETQAVFQRASDAPLGHDTGNAGYIHAPSLNHAATAAILKNAYRVHASAANPDAMAVNLTSNRVREAMAVLEGIRNGQALAALLGYRFERGLHDAHALAEVDKFIYPLRQVFPLVANRLKSTKPDDPTDITLLEARNVLDGLSLSARVRTAGHATYPFGFPLGTDPGQLPPATAAERDAITAQAKALAGLYDSIADLILAESTYQVVLGNFDRAAANTEAFGKGSYPPETQVVETPRSGLTLTHRVALHLDAAANPAVSPNAVPMTPRANAEAALNKWLAQHLPDPGDVAVRVTYSSPVVALKSVTITQADLRLQPIDMLMLGDLGSEQAQSELDDRVVQAIRYGPDAHPDLAIAIEYTQPIAGKVSVFELAALIRSLRTLLLKSRALGPADLAMPLETERDEAVWDDAEMSARVNAAIATLTARRNALVVLAAAASDLDDYARDVSNEFLVVALHGLPQTGTGQIHADARAIYEAVTGKVNDFVARWQQKDADFTTLIGTLPAQPTEEARMALLRKAEGIIAASSTAQPPAPSVLYKANIIDPLKLQFDGRRAQLQALLTFAGKVATFVASAAGLSPALAQHDAVPLDVAPQAAALVTLRDTLVSRVNALAADLTDRITKAQDDLTAAVANDNGSERLEQVRTAAGRVLGEAPLVPRFRLSDARGLEFDAARVGSPGLLTDLLANGRQYPLDDWLYGMARVRDKLAAWENTTVLVEAFGAPAPDLTPVQLPSAPDDRWFALEFDPAKRPATSRLLYTAHFATAFNRAADQCGLLLDEWTEVVPAADVMSGVTFHFDRPSSQPPQTILVAVPSAFTGHWQWEDLVALLVETLDGAKARAVEPAQVDKSPYAQFLPATLMAVTLYQITIATNLSMNNRIYERIGS